jgi:hypothetical protein
MASVSEVPITLPTDVAESAIALAKAQKCTVDELLREALHRYEDAERLMTAISSGGDRSEALEDFLMDYIDRIVHQSRAEIAAEARENAVGERKAS